MPRENKIVPRWLYIFFLCLANPSTISCGKFNHFSNATACDVLCHTLCK